MKQSTSVQGSFMSNQKLHKVNKNHNNDAGLWLSEETGAKVGKEGMCLVENSEAGDRK